MGGKGSPKRTSADEVEPDWLDFSAEFEIGVGELKLRPSEFWELTPAEFYCMVEGYRRMQIRHVNEIIYGAWHVAALSRQKQLPSLKSLLQDEARRQQTDDEMMAMAKMLNAAFGGEVVEA